MFVELIFYRVRGGKKDTLAEKNETRGVLGNKFYFAGYFDYC